MHACVDLVPDTSRDLRIQVFSVCWNEERMLPFFFRHYEGFSDRIIIYDNQSTDRSCDIISSHPLAELRHWNTNGFLNNSAMMAVKNTCWRNTTDWTIVVDIDEFVYYPHLRALLAKPDTPPAIKCVGCQMVSEQWPQTDSQLTDVVRNGIPCHYFDKVSLFDASRVKFINYGPGCHESLPILHDGTQAIVKKTPVKLLHYKFLSRSWVVERYAQLHARRSEQDIVHGYATHYLDIDRAVMEYDDAIAHATDVVG